MKWTIALAMFTAVVCSFLMGVEDGLAKAQAETAKAAYCLGKGANETLCAGLPTTSE